MGAPATAPHAARGVKWRCPAASGRPPLGGRAVSDKTYGPAQGGNPGAGEGGAGVTSMRADLFRSTAPWAEEAAARGSSRLGSRGLPRALAFAAALWAVTLAEIGAAQATPGQGDGGDPAAPAAARMTVRHFATARAALASLLGGRPRVVAFGEIHPTSTGPKVPSSLKRFSDELLDLLRPLASDLLVETWVTEGTCGRSETQVVEKVEKTTERPRSTENELVSLLKRAKAAGVAPHILRVSCADYRSIVADGGIDFERMLRLLRDLLHRNIVALLDGRPAESNRPAAASAARRRRPVAGRSWSTVVRCTTISTHGRSSKTTASGLPSIGRPAAATWRWTSTCPSTWTATSWCRRSPGMPSTGRRSGPVGCRSSSALRARTSSCSPGVPPVLRRGAEGMPRARRTRTRHSPMAEDDAGYDVPRERRWCHHVH